MGSTANPLFSGLVPGGTNPPGNLLSFLDSTKNAKGANALIPNTNLSPSSVGTANPYDIVPGGSSSTTTPPSFPANASPFGAPSNLGAPSSASAGGTNNPFVGMGDSGWKNLFNGLKKTFGFGPAQAIVAFLQSGAGFNQQAINNLFAALQPGIQRGEEDILSQFSAGGNRFGSGAQIGLGDFLSQANLNEGQLETQMYEQSINDYINVLMGAVDKNANRIASSPSGFDKVLGALGIGGSAAGGLSSAISAISPTADTGILDAIAGALAFA